LAGAEEAAQRKVGTGWRSRIHLIRNKLYLQYRSFFPRETNSTRPECGRRRQHRHLYNRHRNAHLRQVSKPRFVHPLTIQKPGRCRTLEGRAGSFLEWPRSAGHWPALGVRQRMGTSRQHLAAMRHGTIRPPPFPTSGRPAASNAVAMRGCSTECA